MRLCVEEHRSSLATDFIVSKKKNCFSVVTATDRHDEVRTERWSHVTRLGNTPKG